MCCNVIVSILAVLDSNQLFKGSQKRADYQASVLFINSLSITIPNSIITNNIYLSIAKTNKNSGHNSAPNNNRNYKNHYGLQRDERHQPHTIHYTRSTYLTQVVESKQLTNETFWIRGKSTLTQDPVTIMYYAGGAVIYNTNTIIGEY